MMVTSSCSGEAASESSSVIAVCRVVSTRVLAVSAIAFCLGKQVFVWALRPLLPLHGLEHSGQGIISGNRIFLVVSAGVRTRDFFF